MVDTPHQRPSQAGVGFGYVTNWLEGLDDRRAVSVIDALRDVIERGA